MEPLTLLTLARDNKVAEIKAAVAKGIPVDVSNQMGQTALHIASLWGNVETITAILELGCDASIKNSRGTTPLHFAASAKKNAMQACKVLVSAGADTKAVDMSGRVPYECADADEIRTLLGGPDSRLFQYCDDGNAQGLRELLAGGTVSSLKVVNSDGHTPLNLAVAAESLETVKVLLEHEPGCIEMTDINGDTVLHVAVEIGNLNVLRYLLTLNPKINEQNMNTSEYASGNWSLHGETILPYDKAPLHVAVEQGDIEAVKVLLEAGADVNLLDFDKSSALHLALEMLDMDLVELLLSKGADVNQPHSDFISPLHLAATRGPTKLLQMLLDKGADVTVVNTENWTPLHLAARAGATEKIGFLIDAGSDVNAANAQGNTPLHLAAINGHTAAIQALLQHNPDKQVVNKEGKVPARVAKTADVATLLL